MKVKVYKEENKTKLKSEINKKISTEIQTESIKKKK